MAGSGLEEAGSGFFMNGTQPPTCFLEKPFPVPCPCVDSS